MEEHIYENEEWYPTLCFDEYQVSNYGRVKSLNYKNKGIVKILEPTAKDGNYLKVGLHKDGKVYYRRVHRLVAEAFLPPPESGQTQINHIDGNRQNNVVANGKCNLEWCTPKENVNNPNTKPRMSNRYHKEGAFERRSAAQKKRFKEHPEDLQKLWDGRRKNKKKED